MAFRHDDDVRHTKQRFRSAVIAKVGGQLSDDESDVMFYDAPLIAMFEPAVGSTRCAYSQFEV